MSLASGGSTVWRAAVFAAVCLCAGAEAALAQSADRWESALQQLGSSDFATRERGQKELQAANWRDLAALRSVAEGTRDAEVEARLQAVIARIEEENALHPPPISLRVANVDIQGLAEALGKATGLRMTGVAGAPSTGTTSQTTSSAPASSSAPSSFRYTLDDVDRPFWDVIAEINRQHAVRVSGPTVDGRFELLEGNCEMHTAANYDAASGVAAFPLRLTDTRSIGGPGKTERTRYVELSYLLAVDPRMWVCGMNSSVSIEVRDGAGAAPREGNLLYAYPPPGKAAEYYEMDFHFAPGPFAVHTLQLLKLPEAGRRISLATCQAALKVVTRQNVVTVPLADEEHVAVAAGDRTIHFSRDGEMFYKVVVERQARGAAEKVAAEADTARKDVDGAAIGVELATAEGRIVWSGTWAGYQTRIELPKDTRWPLTARVHVPSRVVRLPVSFTFRDLPLPP